MKLKAVTQKCQIDHLEILVTDMVWELEGIIRKKEEKNWLAGVKKMWVLILALLALAPWWKCSVICEQPLLRSRCVAICTRLQQCGLGQRKTGNWSLIKLVLNQVSSSVQRQHHQGTGMWHSSRNITEYIRKVVLIIWTCPGFLAFIELCTQPSFSLSLHFFSHPSL